MSKVIKRFSQLSPTPEEAYEYVFGLQPRCADRVVTYLKEHDPDVFMFLQEMPKVILVGGALRNILSPWEENCIKDYDFATLEGGPSQSEQEKWWMDNDAADLIRYPKCSEIRRRSDKPPVQFLDERGEDPWDIIDRFDFSICQLALYLVNNSSGGLWTIARGRNTLMDLADQRLRFTNLKRHAWSGTSVARAFKFSRMGYNITDLSMAQLLKSGYEETKEKYKEWEAFEEHFPDVHDIQEYGDPFDPWQANFIPRFQRGLAYYNKGGSM